ncbi:unnamed protein product [Gadus morhua 'NCC']
MGYSRLFYSIIGTVVHLWDFSAESRINVALSGTAFQSQPAMAGRLNAPLMGTATPSGLTRAAPIPPRKNRGGGSS